MVRRRNPGIAQIKLTHYLSPESFHITLKFLGGVEPARLQGVWEAARAALAGAERFCCHLHGVGAFPNTTRVRVVWAGVEQGRTELIEIAQRVERACTIFGFAPENRPFQAHLTLGRVKEPVLNPELAEALEGFASEPLGEVWVDSVLLMKSELTPKGAVYTVLERHALAG